ncbi:MAG: hypothetical protein ACYC3P_09355 [Bellilinea sp.]
MKIFRPLLIWLSQGLRLVNGIISWGLEPLRGVWWLVSQIFKKRPEPTTS